MLKDKNNMNQEIECKSKIFCCGIDGVNKDYQVISYCDKNKNLVKEETICLNDKLKAIYKAEIFEYERIHYMNAIKTIMMNAVKRVAQSMTVASIH